MVQNASGAVTVVADRMSRIDMRVIVEVEGLPMTQPSVGVPHTLSMLILIRVL